MVQFAERSAENTPVQQNGAPAGAPSSAASTVRTVDALTARPRPGTGEGPDVVDRDQRRAVTVLPRARRRSPVRRAHVRVPGATAGTVERLAWGASTETDLPPTAAVSVVPGAALPTRIRVPVTGADLDEVLGDEESGCAPGRHRASPRSWAVLRRLPGFRTAVPPTWDDADADLADVADVAGVAPDTDDDDAYPADRPSPPDLEPVVPAPRSEGQGPRPQPRRRSPALAMRAALQDAARRIEVAQDASAVARATCEEAARLVDADVGALVLRTVQGPRVLGLHPGGPDAAGLWGPATLAALLQVGRPVRRVVEGDPLADGQATALLAVPVPIGGSTGGTLLARREDDRTFTAAEEDVLRRLARMAGAGLLAASNPTPRGPQDRDAVTGLPLSRRFAADVEAAVRTSQRSGTPVSVLGIHVEGLARIRSELGDPPAEETLQTLVRAFGRVQRVGDLAYRIGPDELALLLPATDPSELPAVRERLDGVAAEVVGRLSLPGSRRALALRTAPVPLTGVLVGGSVVDATTRALELDRRRARWSPA